MFTVQFSREELLALGALLDSANRHDGAKSAKVVAHFLDKFENATPVKPAETPSEIPKDQE